jgi:hypothetical protein
MSTPSMRAFFALLATTMVTLPVVGECSDYTLRAPRDETYTVAQDIVPVAPTGQTLHVCRTVIS